jgi:hypothetical protein
VNDPFIVVFPMKNTSASFVSVALKVYEEVNRAFADGDIMKKTMTIPARRYGAFIRIADDTGVLKSFFYR